MFGLFFVILQTSYEKFLNRYKNMGLIEQIIARAKSNKQRIVLPEAEEERTLMAADRVLADDMADLILIGNPEKVHALA